MQWAALVAWVATAVGGLVLLLQWLRHGGLNQQEGIRARRLLPHLGLAVGGLAFWVGYVASENRALAWIAVGILVAVALLGISMLVISLRGRTTNLRTDTPAEGMFPFPLVVVHGALAVTTLLVSILAAAGL